MQNYKSVKAGDFTLEIIGNIHSNPDLLEVTLCAQK